MVREKESNIAVGWSFIFLLFVFLFINDGISTNVRLFYLPMTAFCTQTLPVLADYKRT